MAVKIRLQRHGRKKAPYYHIVIADARAPRDGKFIENLGMYNPKSKPATIEINQDRALYWVMEGAQPTDTVKAILKYKGVMYRKHLQLGVNKGAISQDAADAKYSEWIGKKENAIQSAVLKSKKEIDAFHSQMIATTRVKKAKEVAVEATVEEATSAPEAEATKDTNE